MSSAIEKLMPGFQNTFFKEDFTDKTVIDFACGFGTWGHTIRTMIIQGGDKAYIVGCDIFKPFLVKNKKYNPYDDLVVCDARYLPFKSKCANIVLCFEMIEHMQKEEGFKLLSDLDDLTKDKLVVSTPNGYMEQPDMGTVQFEEHKSFWLGRDFENKGFKVRKLGLGDYLEYNCRRVRFRNHTLTDAIDRFELLRSKNRWNGVMLIAEKQNSTEKECDLSYVQRVHLLIK